MPKFVVRSTEATAKAFFTIKIVGGTDADADADADAGAGGVGSGGL